MTFTKEQLITQAREEVAFWRERDELIPSQQTAIRLRLAEITLAALTAEPVAWTDEQELRDVAKDGCGYLFTVKPITPHADPRRVIKLYAAPPGPVVPDEAIPQSIEILASTYAPRGVTYQWDKDECNAAADSWNACRAAMLAAAMKQEPLYTCPACHQQSYEDMGHGALRCCDCGNHFTRNED